METLSKSFEKYRGLRGVHLVSPGECFFFPWNEVSKLQAEVSVEQESEFEENLLTVLSNYNPDNEFLVLNRRGKSIFIELYACQK
jgi:hypothetical protein